MAQPVAKLRAGQVFCALWQNEAKVKGQVVELLKATVERRYQNGDGEWKSSGSFSQNEIPLAIYCLQKAFEHMIEKQQEKSNTPVEEVN